MAVLIAVSAIRTAGFTRHFDGDLFSASHAHEIQVIWQGNDSETTN